MARRLSRKTKFARFFGHTGSNAAGFAIGAAIHPTLQPITQEVTNETWQLYPNRPLTVEQAAAAVERGEMTYAAAEDEAQLTGHNAQRFRIIERLAGLAPSTEQLLSLRRRKAITDERLHEGLVQGNVRSEWAAELMRLSEQLLSTGELANMVVQGVLEQDAAAALAAMVGVSGPNFGRLVQLAGSPIGGHEALDLWNRGDIAEADVDRALRQSHLKPEWVAPFKALRRYLPSVSDLTRFAVREVFSSDIRRQYGLDDDFPPVFAQRAAERGLNAEDAHAYWAAHWELPSITQGYHMRWRGIIGDAELDTLLRTKDVMPYWRAKLKAAANIVPGRIDLRRFRAAGLISHDQVYNGYKALGYSDEHARWNADFAELGSRATAKEATAANLRAEYEGLFLSRAELVTGLEALGYDTPDANELADLGDAARVKAYRDRVLTAIYKAYLARHLTEAQARVALADDGIAADAADHLLTLWAREAALTKHELTEAQIVNAYRRAVLTFAQALAELTDRGLSDPDARTLLGTAATPLTDAEVKAGYQAGTLTTDEARAALASSGHTPATIAELFALWDAG